ncbi:MAG TPA: PhoH family protein [Gammaproteobacteria bacterium]|nr:PhoH family protein [Gammaproteobacteria bacterium]
MNEDAAPATESSARRLFVLDTNVLMHDPASLFRFAEHDIFIPMVVLEELDANKKGVSEPARNVRQASRFLDELVRDRDRGEIEAGIALDPVANGNGRHAGGRLFLQTAPLEPHNATVLAADKADNQMLATTLALAERHPERVTLVSKDINLRIKAAVLGLKVEDYYNDKVLDDSDLLYRGVEMLPDDFFADAGRRVESWHAEGRTYYRLPLPVFPVRANQFLYSEGEGEGMELRVRDIAADSFTAELAWDYRRERHAVWGVAARNREQSFALNLLMNPELDFVTLIGPAGTGKTLLALAAGLAQTLDDKRYREIVMTRVTVPLGEDIGFLPGTEEEKMTPWMGALMDNLEVLTTSEEGGTWGRGATQDLLASRIKIRSLNFMRGRTFLNRYIIIDEAQNLTAKQLRALVTRAGPGTKMIALGNIAQIDTPYLSETTSGLTYVVERFQDWPYAGHITLQRVERSRLADYATEIL